MPDLWSWAVMFARESWTSLQQFSLLPAISYIYLSNSSSSSDEFKDGQFYLHVTEVSCNFSMALLQEEVTKSFNGFAVVSWMVEQFPYINSHMVKMSQWSYTTTAIISPVLCRDYKYWMIGDSPVDVNLRLVHIPPFGAYSSAVSFLMKKLAVAIPSNVEKVNLKLENESNLSFCHLVTR